MIIALLALLLAGCVPGNLQGVVAELAKDPNPNCITVGTVYGTLVIARGSPTTAVNVSGGACTLTGTGMVSVPVTLPPQQLTPVPFNKAP